jgi:hypothetical protein
VCLYVCKLVEHRVKKNRKTVITFHARENKSTNEILVFRPQGKIIYRQDATIGVSFGI